jgi:hypothetical protein
LISRAIPSLGIGGKIFVREDLKSYYRALRPFCPFITGVSYNELFARPEDVRKMNELLAELSGRKVEDFEGTSRLESFIKK